MITASRGLRGTRGWVWAVLALLLLGGAALALAARQGPEPLPERPAAERPELMLLTSLPLIFSESFSLNDGGSAALSALETRYRVEPIGVAAADELRGAEMLLMAHAQAQPAEALVELDGWVRRGGRLVLLADPRLEWPSGRALGDKLRPSPSFPDTGLLKHWGLTLYAPEAGGEVERTVDGREVTLRSPGSIEGGCRIDAGGLVARCRIGRGAATVIADADFLNVEDAKSPNLQLLLAELERIER